MLYDYGLVTPRTAADEADAAIARADVLVERAVSSHERPNFADTLQSLELAGAQISVGYGRSAFMAQVHPDSAVRDAAQEAEERITKWRVAVVFRDDVYRAVAAFADTDEARTLTGERARLLSHWLRDFRRAGHELAAEQRADLESQRDRLVELEVAFARNLNEFQDWIEVDREGLAGLSESFVERLKPGSSPGTYRVSLDYPEVNPFLERARNRGHRETIFRKNWNKAVEANRPLLAEALKVRRRIADLLDQPTWAHYAMEVKMASSPARVRDFYDQLVPPLEAAARREIQAMRELHAAAGATDAVQPWDSNYYDTRQSMEEFGVDQNEVSEYLPLDPVLDGMFALTGEVFGLDYERVPDAGAWHPSVQLFRIRDRASGEVIAHFYADLFPREGKFGHAAAFPIMIGHQAGEGSYVKPISAIVANFTPPSGGRPSLLTHGPHGEIETLFHEFGHILHMSLTQAEFTRFSGAETEWDFVEAPSQIMEHWVWEPDVLARFARHYRTGEPIPRQLVERMAASRYLNVGLRATRQVFFGTMDLALHAATSAEPDMDAAMRDSWEVTQLPYPEDTFMLAGFGHLMGGYDAGYYGYLWAEVIGDDMWGRFATEGITSPEVGRAYRQAILEPNGSKSGDDLMAGFLGRPASIDSFLHMRGMAATADLPAG